MLITILNIQWINYGWYTWSTVKTMNFCVWFEYSFLQFIWYSISWYTIQSWNVCKRIYGFLKLQEAVTILAYPLDWFWWNPWKIVSLGGHPLRFRGVFLHNAVGVIVLQKLRVSCEIVLVVVHPFCHSFANESFKFTLMKWFLLALDGQY